tara:strand:+ start:2882 stop:3067 length:186 start_codon:yes stop_codon:yes gene_type:complete
MIKVGYGKYLDGTKFVELFIEEDELSLKLELDEAKAFVMDLNTAIDIMDEHFTENTNEVEF